MRDDETETISLARVGSVINGKWTVDRLIGVGGMASVYAATHRNSKRAALKIMHPELSAQSTIRERFLREGYLSNMVDHPGVVSIDDDDITEDGCAYLVMELVEGETLEARLRRKGPLPPEEVLSFMDQVLHALATAHTRGVVHRDLKPENLLLAQNGEVKLLDFGIARARALSTDPTKTLTEGLMGTPAFMPPEQARGRWAEVDAQSDVWALGATMFTLLTGRNVHQAATTNEALAVAMMRHAPRLEEYRADLPSSLLELVNKALAFDKKDRWPNATVMLLAVRKASSRLEDETLEAEAEAAALAVHSDSQPELFFAEAEPETSDTQFEPVSEPETSAPEQTALFSRSIALTSPSSAPSRPSAPAALRGEPRTSPRSSPPPAAVEGPLSAAAPTAETAESGSASAAESEKRRAVGATTLVAVPRRAQPSRPPLRTAEQPSRPPPPRPPPRTEQPSGPPPVPPAFRGVETSPAPELPPAFALGEASTAAEPVVGEYSVETQGVAEGSGSGPVFEVFSPVPPPISSAPISSAPFAHDYPETPGASAADSALPARRIVQFSDVPAASPVVARSTETTTARSALTLAASVPARYPWSLIGGGVAALILLSLLVVALTGENDEPPATAAAGVADEDSRVDAVDQAAPSPPPVPAPTRPRKRAADRRSGALPAPKSNATAVKPPVRSAAVGQAVDLEALPVLSADASVEPSARAGSVQSRTTPKPAGKTDSNIFNQAKNLAKKRATQRSGQVKTGSGD